MQKKQAVREDKDGIKRKRMSRSRQSGFSAPTMSRGEGLVGNPAGLLQLQRTIGNKAVSQIIRHPQKRVTGTNALIQRTIHSKADRAIQAAENQIPGFSDFVPYPGADQRNLRDVLDNAQLFGAKKQKELIHLWSKSKKKRYKHDGEIEERLEFVRAYLLKKVILRFWEIYRENMMMVNPDNAQQARKLFMKLAIKETTSLRDKLLGFGLAKGGAIRHELNNLFMEEGVPMSDETEVEDPGPRLEIRGTTIPGGGLPGNWHSFLVYTDYVGQQFYFSAHADENGILHATMNVYAPGVHEWQPTADRKLLEESEDLPDKWNMIGVLAEQINNADIPYDTLSTNCNRAAYHVLNEAGINRVKQAGALYVGWGEMLDM